VDKSDFLARYALLSGVDGRQRQRKADRKILFAQGLV
jgi:hypothetical protein